MTLKKSIAPKCLNEHAYFDEQIKKYDGKTQMLILSGKSTYISVVHLKHALSTFLVLTISAKDLKYSLQSRSSI
eukprot:c24583_g1_i1 orf=41-262(-)